ncbi:MAG: hypothetical protein WC551_10250 [Patescibacteria group bacterium]
MTLGIIGRVEELRTEHEARAVEIKKLIDSLSQDREKMIRGLEEVRILELRIGVNNRILKHLEHGELVDFSELRALVDSPEYKKAVTEAWKGETP